MLFIKQKNPTVLGLPCASHETNLLIGDILKHSAVQNTILKAIQIITYFRKASRVLIQLCKNLKNDTFRFQLPTLTRWGSFYKSLNSLLKNKKPIEVYYN